MWRSPARSGPTKACHAPPSRPPDPSVAALAGGLGSTRDVACTPRRAATRSVRQGRPAASRGADAHGSRDGRSPPCRSPTTAWSCATRSPTLGSTAGQRHRARRRRVRRQPGQRHHHGLPVRVDGDLSPLPGSTRPLTPNPAGGITDAAQIQFTPDGSALLVTEKASNTLDTFAVRGGYAGTAVPHASAGTTPYGFDFDARGHAIVSEAASGSASSYASAGAASASSPPR